MDVSLRMVSDEVADAASDAVYEITVGPVSERTDRERGIAREVYRGAVAAALDKMATYEYAVQGSRVDDGEVFDWFFVSDLEKGLELAKQSNQDEDEDDAFEVVWSVVRRPVIQMFGDWEIIEKEEK